MKKGVFLRVVCVMLYVRSVLPEPTDLEMVWLKDVTTSVETGKRTLSDPDLPDELTFHLSRGSHDLTLNLKRNHGINPNANVYVVRTLKNGESLLEKTHLEKEAVAYYQDRKNGVFMTVRCAKRSNEQCERVINGNIRIGDRNYDLRPAETDVTSRNLDVTDLLGTRYVLHDQANIQRDISIKENKDAANVNEKNVEQERIDLLRSSTREQEKRNHFLPTNSTLSSRNIADLHNRGTTDKKDNIKAVSWIEIVVLLDSGIWDLYSSIVETNGAPVDDVQVERKIREAYSHYINGIQGDFPHHASVVTKIDSTIGYIEVTNYAYDIAKWDLTVGSTYEIDYDHAMLFTRYDLYAGTTQHNDITGYSVSNGICDTGKRISIIEAGDFYLTVSTATHELGHNLGAVHDGEPGAESCPAEDFFIMSHITPDFDIDKPYFRNPWIFSNCSVEAFKKTLKNKTCVTNKGILFDNEEWTEYMMKLPGEVYTPNEQCGFANGPKSVYCGNVPSVICLFMECTDPETGDCLMIDFTAATGTSCGENRWCKDGNCVSKS